MIWEVALFATAFGVGVVLIIAGLFI